MKYTFVLSAIAAVCAAAKIGPDAFKTLEQICFENGLKSEGTTLVTEDGYVLGLRRIPGKFTDDAQLQKPVVLFMHCQDCDHMEFVSNEAEKAPAIVLANLGYDVWLGNNRGNRFSLAHLDKHPSEKSFWDFY